MKDLIANGWKTENGFKPAYLLKLENNNSGIGFNATTGLLQCHDDYWDRIVKADPNATTMRYKTCPLYDNWNEMFGMDRANGRAAEDVVDAANAIRSEDAPSLGDHAGDPPDHVPVETSVDMDFISESPAVDNSTAVKVCEKKRFVVESPHADRICDVIGQFCRASDNRFDSLVHVIGYESTIGGARNELPKVVVGIPEQTEDERIDAAHMFAKNADCLEMFMGMADESRAHYVHRLLNGHLKM
ncbi:hypothetical protein ACS0TY_033317 [Phlomoides rotata]